MPFLQGLGLNLRVSCRSPAWSRCSRRCCSRSTPALRLSSPVIRDGLAEGSRGSAGTIWRRLGSRLVVLELAMAMVLLVCAGLLGKSLYRLLQVDLGLRPDDLVTLQIAAPSAVLRQGRAGDRPGEGDRAAGPGPARRPGGRDRDQRPSRGRQRQHHLVPGAGPALARRAQRMPRARRQPRLLHDGGGDAAARALLHRGRRRKEAARRDHQRGHGPGALPERRPSGQAALLPLGSAGAHRDRRRSWRTSAKDRSTRRSRRSLYIPFNQSTGNYLGVVVRTSQSGASLLARAQSDAVRADRSQHRRSPRPRP